MHKILVRGTVQGVGFRPFIYRLANEMDLSGSVHNSSQGVIIHLRPDGATDEFIARIRTEAPPAARIEDILVTENGDLASSNNPIELADGFHIVESEDDSSSVTGIPADIALCDACLSELRYSADRRHNYPFINCTDCGPRYSITRSVPYDRPNTTMDKFSMCPECEAEYHDQGSRRFHAQPNACPKCGPSVWFVDQQGSSCTEEAALKSARRALANGKIIAIKGLGGFHLACDATDPSAVLRLRQRKRPSNKPFAIMLPDLKAAQDYCEVSEAASTVLEGPVRPIVIMRRRAEGPAQGTDHGIAQPVAPGSDRLGVMLPYTPIHHLLFGDADAIDDPTSLVALVMTSGNQADEPIATGNDEAMMRLAGIADGFLLHDRDIHTRVDDSIMIDPGDGARPVVTRRARGFAPHSIDLASTGDHPHLFAAGADLKGAFCLARDGRAVLGQHIGDLQGDQSIEFFEDTLGLLRDSYRVEPDIVASDMHPDYVSTRIADRVAGSLADPTTPLRVQHHHAHIVSAMVEHGLTDPVIGIALDGTGFGPDGTVWGGEVLRCDRSNCERIAHLWPVALPGGDKAALEPWRMALSHLYSAASEGDSVAADFSTGVSRFRAIMPASEGGPDDEALSVVVRMLEAGVNSPMSTSAGRLFDAVAAIAGICSLNTYEGEAAILLQQSAERCESSPSLYSWAMDGSRIDTRRMIMQILGDVESGRNIEEIAMAFHLTLAKMVSESAALEADEAGLDRAVLSGGVFQNALLSKLVASALASKGIKVFMHESVPANDGGISLGQAAIVAARLSQEESI